MTRRLDRAELLVVLLGCPSAATVAWHFGLRVAGIILWAVWAIVAVLYLLGRLRPADGGEVPVPPAPGVPPVGTSSTVDPRAAFLDALGSDVTGRLP